MAFFNTPPPPQSNPQKISTSDFNHDSISDEKIFPEIGYLVFRECTPDWKIKDRLGVFNFWDLTYLTQGSACYTIDGTRYDLNAGDLICLPPGHSREAKTWPERLMHCFAVNFSLKSLESGKTAAIPLPLISHIGIREDIIQLFNELVFTWIHPQPLYEFKVRALFMLILHRFLETALFSINSSVSNSHVRMVLRHIAAHYPEKITVEGMGRLCNLSPVYLGALFRRETGMTIHQYLAKTRIKYAENFLRSGEFRVSEAAERCGYGDIFHFYKHFKLICGISPSMCIPRKKKQ
jgi:AraC-like DNA-binding protein